jgi:hypothetical protein
MPSRQLLNSFAKLSVVMCCVFGCARNDPSPTADATAAPAVAAFLGAVAKSDPAEVAVELMRLSAIPAPPESAAIFRWSIGPKGAVAHTPVDGDSIEIAADRFLLLRQALEFVSVRDGLSTAEKARAYEIVLQLGDSLSEYSEELGGNVLTVLRSNGIEDFDRASIRFEVVSLGVIVQRIALERLGELPRETVTPECLARWRASLELARQRRSKLMSEIERATGLQHSAR